MEIVAILRFGGSFSTILQLEVLSSFLLFLKTRSLAIRVRENHEGLVIFHLFSNFVRIEVFQRHDLNADLKLNPEFLLAE